MVCLFCHIRLNSIMWFFKTAAAVSGHMNISQDLKAPRYNPKRWPGRVGNV